MVRLLIIATVVNTLEGFLLPYGEHYRALGWTVDALARGAAQSAACRRAFSRVWDAPWSRNPLDLADNYAGAHRLMQLAADGGYDLVHVHTPVAGFASRWALRSGRPHPRIVYTTHGFHFYRGAPLRNHLLFRTLEKRAARWTDALVVINREDERAALAWHILDENRIFYIPGIGIDLKRFDPDMISPEQTAQLRRSLGLSEKHCLFLVLGEMIARKRPADALMAFARMDHKCRLLFAGEGPLRSSLERLAAELGIGNRVLFLGQRRDVACLLKASDAVILASQQEGLPRCVMEAMAMSVPVIGSNIRGTTDLLACGAGLLFEPGDIAGLHRAMTQIQISPNNGGRMGQIGRQAALAYDIDSVLALHDQMYERVLADKQVPDEHEVLTC